MNRNRKLENLVVGRSITDIGEKDGSQTITLDDRSVIVVKGKLGDLPTGVAISTVFQGGTVLRFVFSDGESRDIALLSEGSSVLMRTSAGGFAYSD